MEIRIEHLDPPMGVAFGPFSPTSDYAPDAHANGVEGEYVADRGRYLVAAADRHGSLAASVAIEDSAAPDIGKQLALFFKDGEDFDALFVTHPDYRVYYPDRDNGG